MKFFTKATIFAASAAGLATVGYVISKKRKELTHSIKSAAKAVKLTFPVEKKYDNNAALTPPMGWSSWNTFRNRIDENLIYETAKAMKNAGLIDAGYQYLNIDDCWQSSFRDEKGRLQGDLVKFSEGIAPLAQKVNELGMKLGIYSSNGSLTCEDLPASLGNEATDADTFAEWGIEYFKYDFCHNVPIPTKAPLIEKITISRPDSSEEHIYPVSSAVLHGEAEIVKDESLESGEYVGGLSKNFGSIVFENVEAAEEGEYILTLCVRKKSNSKKYAEILINSEEKYSLLIPPTSAFSSSGRSQMKISLNKGVNTIKIYNPVASKQDSAAIQFTKMGEELKRATREYSEKTGKPERPIVYSICEWGSNFPWRWGKQAGNLWRTTPDIKAVWTSILAIYEFNIKLYKNAEPGAWNDPDMLEVGNGSLTNEENKSHFTLWCMMAAPLILGNDIRNLLNEDGTPKEDNKTLQIITNKDLIAIDQDPLGVQCRRIRTSVLCDTLIKPLVNDEFAICFFNKSNEEKELECDVNDVLCRSYISTHYANRYEIFDLWNKDRLEIKNIISASVPAHGVKVFRVAAKRD